MATRKHFSYQTPAGEEKTFEVDTPPAGTVERAILATEFGLDPPSIKFNGRSYSPDAAGQYHLPVGVGDDPADPVCVTGTPTGTTTQPEDPVLHFKSLLAQARYSTRNLHEDAINFLKRYRLVNMMHARTPEEASELYEEAKLVPSASTKAHIVTQAGIKINGPAFISTALESAPASILTAVSNDGAPRMVKLCRQSTRGLAEVAMCEALCTRLAAVDENDHGCVRADIAPIHLNDKHQSTGHTPGFYNLIVMPRYVYSLATQLPIPQEVIARHLRRLITAVSHVHSRGVVHMDIKGANIFVDMSGQVHLGDFGSAVAVGAAVTDTTEMFTEGWHVWDKTQASAAFDWYMLAVAGAVEVVKEGWFDALLCTERRVPVTPKNKLLAIIEKEVNDQDLKDAFRQIMALYEAA